MKGQSLWSIAGEFEVTYERVCQAFYQYCEEQKQKPGWPSVPLRVQKIWFGHPTQMSPDEEDYGWKEWKPTQFNKLSQEEQVIYVKGL